MLSFTWPNNAYAALLNDALQVASTSTERRLPVQVTSPKKTSRQSARGRLADRLSFRITYDMGISRQVSSEWQERHCAVSQRAARHRHQLTECLVSTSETQFSVRSRQDRVFKQVQHQFSGNFDRRSESLLLEAQSSSNWYCSRLEIFPSHTVFCCVTIATTFGTSQGPRHPLILN